MYREHAPPDPLADVVECFWTIRSASPLPAVVTNRVLPDGCSDIIVDLGEPPAGSTGWYPRSRSYVVGTMRTALVVELTGHIDLLGVRFRPGGGTPVLGVPADELAGQRFALVDVVPKCGNVVDRLAEAVGVSRRQLERLFVRDIGVAPGEACRVARFRGAVGRMALEPRHSLARVAYTSGYCDQAHFSREFRRLAGVPPGAYRRERDVATIQYPDTSHA